MIDIDEAKQFYRVMLSLLDYVNRERQIVADWPASGANAGVSAEQASRVRDVLWAEDALRERFIAENPAGLSEDDLDLAASWKDRISGSFTILRHLKKHSIFLASEGSRGYAVHGLYQPLDAVVSFPPPLYAKTVLLPYKDRVVYDGILIRYSVYLGSGIRADLNARYRNIQEGVGLITALPEAPDALRRGIAQGNDKLLKAYRAYLAGVGLGEKTLAQHTDRLRDVAERLVQAEPPRPLLDMTVTFAERYLTRHPDAATSLKHYARFMERTGRGDPDTTVDLVELRRRG